MGTNRHAGKYKDDVSSAYLTGWQWIDGNGDGVAECYYLDGLGVMNANTSIDGYTVNEQGQWTVAGVIQTKVVSGGSSQLNMKIPSESSVQDNPYVDKSNPYAYDGDYKIPEPTTINIEHDGFVGGSSEGLPAMH